MQMPSFIFGGDTGLSYEQIQRMQELASELKAPREISTVGEGINSFMSDIGGIMASRRADKAEKKGRAEFDSKFNDILGALGSGGGGGYGGGYSGPPGPPPEPVAVTTPGPGGSAEGLTPEAQDVWASISEKARANPQPSQGPSVGRVSSPNDLDEREILARTIAMEAGNQGMEGMMGVGAVMDNRRRAGRFGGNTFRDVALAPAQFSPWNSVTGYAGGEQGSMEWQNPAPPEAYAAADMILSGNYEDPTGGATHFVNHDISQPSWASKMSTKGQIGDHTFYSDNGEGVAGATPASAGQGGGGAGGYRGAPQGGSQGLSQQRRMKLIELANSPWATPAQQAMVSHILERDARREEMRMERESRGRWTAVSKTENGDTVMENSATGEMKVVKTGSASKTTYAPMTPEEMAQWGLDPKTDGPYALGSDGLPKPLRSQPLVEIGGSTAPLTRGQEKVDDKFADDYLEWTGGGRQDFYANQSKLNEALDIVQGGSDMISGPLIGIMPDFIRRWVGPDGIKARDMVEEVVQRNLRLVLGAQFTEKEGARLIARAYNDKLDEATNAKRVKRLMAQIELAAEAKESQTEYYEANGTLRGWSGRTYSTADFDRLLDEMDEADGVETGEADTGRSRERTSQEREDFINNPRVKQIAEESGLTPEEMWDLNQ